MLLSGNTHHNKKMATFVETPQGDTKQENYSVYIEQKDENGQDFAKIVEDGNVIYLVVLDGHGKHKKGSLPEGKDDVITWLQTTLDWDNFLKSNSDNPIMELQYAIAGEYEFTSGIGACCTIAKVTDEKITMWWVGDSKMKVFEGENLVGETKIIREYDAVEQNRQANQLLRITCSNSHNIKILSGTEMTMKPSKYYNVLTKKGFDKVACIQSLGHDLAYGETNNKVEIDFEAGKIYKVVGGSDGLWDMISETESDKSLVCDPEIGAEGPYILSLRWRQEWVYVWQDSRIPNQKIPNPDDICCVTLCKSL